MLKSILLSVLLMSSLWAKLYDDDIVDEAKTISIIGSGESSSSNPTRDVIFNNGEVNVYKNKLSLSSVKKEFIITITDAFHLPNTLVVKRGDKIMHKLQSKVAKDIGFALPKAKLQVGDKIIITTSEDVVMVDMRVVK